MYFGVQRETSDTNKQPSDDRHPAEQTESHAEFQSHQDDQTAEADTLDYSPYS